MSSVRALSKRVGPAADLPVDVPLALAERRQRRRRSDVDRVQRRSARRGRSSHSCGHLLVGGSVERQLAARDDAVDAAPSRRSPSRSPTRRRSSATIVGDVAGRAGAARPGCGTPGPCRGRPWPSRPTGGRRRISVVSGDSAAGRSGWRRRRGTACTSGVPSRSSRNAPACSRSQPATASTSKASSSRTGLLSSLTAALRSGRALSSRAAWARITWSYAARSFSLRAYAARAGSVGDDQLLAAVEPLQHRRGDVVGRDRRASRPGSRSPCRPRRRRGPASSSSGWCGSTTGTPRARRTPYAASSWPVVSVSATTAAFTAL